MSSKLRRGRSIKFPKKHIKGIAGRREGAKKVQNIGKDFKGMDPGWKNKKSKRRTNNPTEI